MENLQPTQEKEVEQWDHSIRAHFASLVDSINQSSHGLGNWETVFKKFETLLQILTNSQAYGYEELLLTSLQELTACSELPEKVFQCSRQVMSLLVPQTSSPDPYPYTPQASMQQAIYLISIIEILKSYALALHPSFKELKLHLLQYLHASLACLNKEALKAETGLVLAIAKEYAGQCHFILSSWYYAYAVQLAGKMQDSELLHQQAARELIYQETYYLYEVFAKPENKLFAFQQARAGQRNPKLLVALGDKLCALGKQLAILNEKEKSDNCYHRLLALINTTKAFPSRYNLECSQGLLPAGSVEQSKVLRMQADFFQAWKERVDQLHQKRQIIAAQLSAAQSIPLLQSNWSSTLTELIAQWCKDIEDRLGPTPCQRFSLLSLGSLAREEAIFFSDLECALVWEGAVGTPEHVQLYFKAFIDLLHLRLMSLTETHYIAGLPTVNASFNLLKQKSVAGLRLDDGGNYPFSAQTLEQMMSSPATKKLFIGTIEEWLPAFPQFQSIHQFQAKMSNKNDCGMYALLDTAYLYGDRELAEKLFAAHQNFLNITDFHVDKVAYRSLLAYGLLTEEFLEKDTQCFGSTLDAKSHLLHLPQRLIAAWSLSYGISALNTMKRVEGLEEAGLLNKATALLFKTLIESAFCIRLQVQDYYQSEKDSIDWGSDSQLFPLNEWHKDRQVSFTIAVEQAHLQFLQETLYPCLRQAWRKWQAQVLKNAFPAKLEVCSPAEWMTYCQHYVAYFAQRNDSKNLLAFYSHLFLDEKKSHQELAKQWLQLHSPLVQLEGKNSYLALVYWVIDVACYAGVEISGANGLENLIPSWLEALAEQKIIPTLLLRMLLSAWQRLQNTHTQPASISNTANDEWWIGFLYEPKILEAILAGQTDVLILGLQTESTAIKVYTSLTRQIIQGNRELSLHRYYYRHLSEATRADYHAFAQHQLQHEYQNLAQEEQQTWMPLPAQEALWDVPAQNGERASHQQRFMRWQQQLQELVIPLENRQPQKKSPLTILIKSILLEGEWQLKPDIVQSLLQGGWIKPNGEFIQKAELEQDSGNHLVFPYPVQAIGDKNQFNLKQFEEESLLFFKVFPEYPLMELYFYDLTCRFSSYPQRHVDVWYWEAGKYRYPVLVSQSMQGKNLLDELAQQPSLDLNRRVFSEAMIVHALTRQEDTKPNNCALVQTANGSVIYPFDTDRWFCSPFDESGQLQVKDIFFCLPQMHFQMDAIAREELLSLNPLALLEAWAETVRKWGERCLAIFGEEVIKTFYQDKKFWAAKKPLIERSLLLYCFPPHVLSQFAQNLTAIVRRLQNNLHLPLWSILDVVSKRLTDCYRLAHNKGKTPIEIFDEACRKAYLVKKGDYISSCIDFAARAEADSFLYPQAEDLIQRWRLQNESLIIEMQRLFGNDQVINEIKEKIIAGKLRGLEQFTHPVLIETLLKNLRGDELRDSIIQRKFIEHVKRCGPYKKLIFAYWSKLRDEDIKVFCQKSPQLTVLSITECVQINGEFLKFWERRASPLRVLILVSLPRLIYVGALQQSLLSMRQQPKILPIRCPDLLKLSMEDCRALRKIAIEDAAFLREDNIHLENIPSLEKMQIQQITCRKGFFDQIVRWKAQGWQNIIDYSFKKELTQQEEIYLSRVIQEEKDRIKKIIPEIFESSYIENVTINNLFAHPLLRYGIHQWLYVKSSLKILNSESISEEYDHLYNVIVIETAGWRKTTLFELMLNMSPELTEKMEKYEFGNCNFIYITCKYFNKIIRCRFLHMTQNSYSTYTCTGGLSEYFKPHIALFLFDGAREELHNWVNFLRFSSVPTILVNFKADKHDAKCFSAQESILRDFYFIEASERAWNDEVWHALGSIVGALSGNYDGPQNMESLLLQFNREQLNRFVQRTHQLFYLSSSFFSGFIMFKSLQAYPRYQGWLIALMQNVKFYDLNLSACLLIDDESLTSIIRASPQLCALNIAGCRGLTGNEWLEIVAQYPTFTALNIEKSSILGRALWAIRNKFSLPAFLEERKNYSVEFLRFLDGCYDDNWSKKASIPQQYQKDLSSKDENLLSDIIQNHLIDLPWGWEDTEYKSEKELSSLLKNPFLRYEWICKSCTHPSREVEQFLKTINNTPQDLQRLINNAKRLFKIEDVFFKKINFVKLKSFPAIQSFALALIQEFSFREPTQLITKNDSPFKMGLAAYSPFWKFEEPKAQLGENKLPANLVTDEEVFQFCRENNIEGITAIIRDGNCFFYAVLAGLPSHHPLNEMDDGYLELRRQAVQYMRDNPERFSSSCVEDTSLDEYLARMERSTVWAEGPIIDATALLLNITINVIELEKNNDEIKTSRQFAASEIENAEGALLVLRVNQNHYYLGRPLQSDLRHEIRPMG